MDDTIIKDNNNQYVTEDGNVINNNNSSNDNTSDLINEDKDNYKNADGTYGKVKSIRVKSPEYFVGEEEEKWDFNLTLSIDGKVYI